jgi:glutamine amidotransferase
VRDHPIFEGIEPGSDFYFVHSFAVSCDDAAHVAATTPYTGGFTSVVARDNAVGVQFHPEKSQQVGQRLIRNFLAWQPC